jgi:asparagine synthase (glutamine-hydrolysing)
MCGIAGKIAFHGEFTVRELFDLSTRISHRGPDDEGYYAEGNDGIAAVYGGVSSPEQIRSSIPAVSNYLDVACRLGLVHRRFSIIDPSPNGHQPWVDSETGVVLVFNGEIYNYVELRRKLSDEGYGPFRSNSDTEVVALAYRAWGVKCFDLFRGFWALAIYNPLERRLILTRDRLGKKPLYYFRASSSFVFASEIRPLIPYLKKEGSFRVDEASAYYYLVHDRRDAFTGSLFAEIQQVPPASYLDINCLTGEVETNTFWSISDVVRRKTVDVEQESLNLLDKMRESVKLRLRADVPVEVNLSGGLDSASIAAIATEFISSGSRLSTHTLRYENDNSLDESKAAESIAEYLGCDHNVLTVSPDQIWESLDSFIFDSEEPVHSPAALVQMLSWKIIAEDGYKVMLHGAANDELMLGYNYLAKIENIHRLKKLNIPSHMYGRPTFHPVNLARLLKWTLQGDFLPNANLQGEGSHQQAWSSEFLAKQLVPSSNYRAFLAKISGSAGSRMLADFEALRIPYWCLSMDKNMMRVPAEVRMPFLDHELVEYAFSLPINTLYRNGYTKYLLRVSMEGLLPDEILWNPTKTGFSVPKKQWLRSHKSIVNSSIMSPRMAEYINQKWVLKNVDSISVDKIWRIVNFERWLEIFGL